MTGNRYSVIENGLVTSIDINLLITGINWIKTGRPKFV